MALHHTAASVVRADIQAQSFLEPKADGQQEEDKFWCDHLENPLCLLHVVPTSSIHPPSGPPTHLSLSMHARDTHTVQMYCLLTSVTNFETYFY
jgi:hypothetical protein